MASVVSSAVLSSCSRALRSSILTTSCSKAVGAAGSNNHFAPHVQRRHFIVYEGQPVSSEALLKKSDDWVIEETNFCLGRVAPIRFKETDDLAHRVLHLMDAQLTKMHTRLRDGTCIPVMGLYIPCVCDKPTPLHQCLEPPLLKWTWDHVYTEAYEDSSSALASPQQVQQQMASTSSNSSTETRKQHQSSSKINA